MENLRKTAAVLIFPALAWVGVACDGTLPTEPQPAVGVPAGGANWDSPSGTTRWVNDDATLPLRPGSSCNNPGYRHIQDAVDDAAPGDRIKVCTGTYQEQVKVGTGKDNIQLISVQLWKAVIKAPMLMTPDVGDITNTIVRVTGAHNVTILGFTISGPGPTGCGSLHYGVRVDNSGSAKILGNHITHIRDNPFSGCQNGVAVIVGAQTPATGQILGNVIDDYQKNGPTVSGAGSSAEISYNRVVGHGANALNAQNGIQVSGGASATVRHNFVAQNIYTLPEFAATGMLFFGPGQVASEHNTVTSNDYGVYTFGLTAGGSVKESRVRASTYDGVVVGASIDNQVSHNASDHNGFTGILLWFDAQNNSIAQNQVQDNNGGGILLDDASRNSVRANHVHRNGNDSPDLTDGIRINAGTGNTVADNRLKRNKTHDCHDETFPLNTWTNNREGTSFPAGLCGDDEDDAGENVDSFGWDANYPWYTSFEDAAGFDWAVGYAEFDLSSILQLLPTIRIGVVARPQPSPHH